MVQLILGIVMLALKLIIPLSIAILIFSQGMILVKSMSRQAEDTTYEKNWSITSLLTLIIGIFLVWFIGGLY